ncbi:MAG TPA: hypothetical protein VHE10_01590 [Candidatus Paceibacterota bacterium]|nr:hypothetical protein [Candidatus Paceibacterota bacterium]
MKKTRLTFNKFAKDPATDWYMCLACLALGLAIVALADFALYRSLVSAGDSAMGAAAPQNILNRADISSVAAGLSQRESVSASAAARSIQDPSI